MQLQSHTAQVMMDEAEPRDMEIMEGLKLAGIALGVAVLAGLLSAGNALIG